MRDSAIRPTLAGALAALLAGAPSLPAQRGRGDQQGPRHAPTTLILSGKVCLPDGSPPPAPVTLVRVCRGQSFPEGYSAPNGEFAIRVGQGGGAAMEDASTYGVDSRGRASGDTVSVGGLTGDTERFSAMKNRGTLDLAGCELQVQLDGFFAEPVLLGRRSVFDNPDLGAIVLRPLRGPGGGTVSASAAAAPKNARKNFERGRDELARAAGDPAKAARWLEQAVAAHPGHAPAWEQLGVARLRLRDEAGALEAYRRALEADPRYVPPYPAAIKLLVRAAAWEPLVETARAYLAMRPGGAQERFYLAVALLNLGRAGEAVAVLDDLLADPDLTARAPQAAHLRGSLLARQGDYGRAAADFERFLAAVPEGEQAEQARRALAEWRALGVAP